MSEKIKQVKNKYVGDCCPNCSSDRIEAEEPKITDLKVTRKASCKFCKNEWQEFYELVHVHKTTSRPIPCSTEEEAWLHGKKTVVFEYPSDYTSKADERMFTDPSFHGKDWWENVHNMVPSYINVEENIDGENSEGVASRFTKTDYSYHEGEEDLELLFSRGVPASLVDAFLMHTREVVTYLELLWSHEDNSMVIITSKHAREHLTYGVTYGHPDPFDGNKGIRYEQLFLRYEKGNSFSDADQESIELKTRGDGTDIPCAMMAVLRNTSKVKKGDWVCYAYGVDNTSIAQKDHIYKVEGVILSSDLMDSLISIRLGPSNVLSYPAKSFRYEPDVVTKVAREFADELLREIGLDKIREIVELNKQNGEGSCASHGFCDSSMTIDRAWKNVFGWLRRMSKEEHILIADNAWTMAMKEEFYVQELDAAVAKERAKEDKKTEAPSFQEYRESRRMCASDSEIYGPEYSGGCFRYGDDSAEIAIDGPDGKFWLVIENQEYVSHNLVDLEIELYLWRYRVYYRK